MQMNIESTENVILLTQIKLNNLKKKIKHVYIWPCY